MRSWKSALGGTATRKKHVGEAQAPGGRMTLAIPSNSKRPSPREFHQSPELESRCRKAGRAAVQPHLGWKASGSLHLGIRYSPSPESAALAPWPRPPSGAAGLPRGLDLGGTYRPGVTKGRSRTTCLQLLRDVLLGSVFAALPHSGGSFWPSHMV